VEYIYQYSWYHLFPSPFAAATSSMVLLLAELMI